MTLQNTHHYMLS